MACNMKTMMKIGGGMLAAAGVAYVLLPQFRELIVALSPALIFLLCPLSMLFAMKAMQGQNGQSCQSSTSEEKDKGHSTKMQAEVRTS
jgi:hypothetical protein